ncbi:unnamed protein product [Lathyrus sativus]|nr:unnamed protein product [Lathyrus sativus]
MDQAQQEQASLREDIDSVKIKIEHILETMQALSRREEDIHAATTARNDAPVQRVVSPLRLSGLIPNRMVYGFPHGFTPPPEATHVPHLIHISRVTDGVTLQGPPIVNQILTPRTDEEVQDEYEMHNYLRVARMVNPAAAQAFKAIQMCHALAEKIRVLEGHNSSGLGALEMCLVPNVVMPPKFKAP